MVCLWYFLEVVCMVLLVLVNRTRDADTSESLSTPIYHVAVWEKWACFTVWLNWQWFGGVNCKPDWLCDVNPVIKQNDASRRFRTSLGIGVVCSFGEKRPVSSFLVFVSISVRVGCGSICQQCKQQTSFSLSIESSRELDYFQGWGWWGRVSCPKCQSRFFQFDPLVTASFFASVIAATSSFNNEILDRTA